MATQERNRWRLYEAVSYRLPKPAGRRMDLFSTRSALRKLGWFRSLDQGMCVDAAGDPVPWYTYPAIAFLAERVPADARVFEFGIGNSTLWWAAHAAKVTACEGNQQWFDRIAPKMPANTTALFFDESSEDYATAAARRGEPFDILVIDGRQRVASCAASLPLLSDAGVVIWDNAERPRYAEGFAMLEAGGFRRLNFWGMGPLNTYEWLTSVFYRPGNILGI